MAEETIYKDRWRIRVVADIERGGYYATVTEKDSPTPILLRTECFGTPTTAQWEAEFLADNHLPIAEDFE